MVLDAEPGLAGVSELASARNGQIPLFAISGSDDDIHIRVFPSETTKKYVAISHVWSDRLGNPEENSLPRCQLFRPKHQQSCCPTNWPVGYRVGLYLIIRNITLFGQWPTPLGNGLLG
jgi:hypothetical protein